MAISAITGEGLSALAERIERGLAGELVDVTVRLSPDRLSRLQTGYESADVVSRQDEEDGSVTLNLRGTRSARDDLEKLSAG